MAMRNRASWAFAVLGLIWGSNFIFMKWASETITPQQITTLRVLFGFLPVFLYASARRVFDRSHLRHAHHFFVMSLLATSLYYFAFAAGTALLPSGIAGALSGAIPLFTFLSAALLLRSERITPMRLLGVLIGFGGVLLIARPWETAGAVDVTGVMYMLLGSASVGLSFVYAKRFLSDRAIPPAALTTYQMGLALATLLIVTDLEGVTAIARDATAAVALVVGLGLLGTGLAYILYYYIVDELGAVTASSATYIPPAVALAIGWLLVNEPLDWLDGLAVALILAGVVVLQLGGAATRRRLKRWRGVAQQSSGVDGVQPWRPQPEKPQHHLHDQ
jgi:drug/metabolite transporter (DMT)-like permease